MAKKKLKTLVLEKSRWARGGLNGGSALLNYKGNMCCLGFLACALGASEGQILKKAMPDETGVDPDYGYWSNLANVPWPKKLDMLAGDISEINDEVSDHELDEISDVDRVKKLQPNFKKMGYRLVLKP